ncbi:MULTISPECIES: alpha/beta hydrolase [unclassified Mucilaginibacter]|uniref:alpha/beta fold hydrolase n=1 Tax=unclassified Mucilaginibacter TaxID=2617802 RepID=UPI002AC89B78|nr:MULTISPECIES: alpha/beta hydrolase [unclassified Mucilaginibacter]MEB0260768.1 alpha/beta hydrolase [Mucilaginibacter sp. 10I4]MEB0278983.1 alpha/beta hydrolase [Mucilaginibacter sp. 10B2]MEB0302347.1 alpha/beta hydrolase [Mucilaginibacter sp. 5C4]WPX22161.1 alpha/beta hydrolase [Mucilaginibacter sp. 5C4]
MPKVYLIAGLGADSRLFKDIILPEAYEVILVDWFVPKPDDTLITYAQSIINQYGIEENSIIIGVSLGGMISVEIAKQVKLNKVILISSIKTDSEAPWYFKFFSSLPVYKAIPGKLMTHLGFLIKGMFGKMNTNDLALFKSMLRNSSPVFMKWAMRVVLYWRNDVEVANLYHIIGDKDLVFPHQNIKNPTAVIKGGTHIMVFDRADEINALLADILK